MKHSQFTELCRREWSQPYRGDVVTLNLTNESLAELTADIANHESPFDCELGTPFENRSKTATVAIRVTEAVNPVTRSTVTVNGDATSTAPPPSAYPTGPSAPNPCYASFRSDSWAPHVR